MTSSYFGCMEKIAKNTVELFGALTAPLVKTGTLHKSEYDAAMRVLESAANTTLASQAVKNHLLTRADAADRLGVCRTTVSRMFHAGELKGLYLRPGSCRSLRISSESIDVMISCGGAS